MEVGIQDNVGQNVIDIGLRRSDKGIVVRLKVAEEVEAFFRRWGGERREDIREYGRLWTNNSLVDKSLAFWYGSKMGRSAGYVFNHPGNELLIPSPRGDDNDAANLSVIQLVGASRPDGISFTVDLVLSKSELRRSRDRLQDAAAQFYDEFIKPVSMEFVVYSKSVGGGA